MNNITAQDIENTITASDPQNITRWFLFDCEAAANELNATDLDLDLDSEEDNAAVWEIIAKHELGDEAAYCTAGSNGGASTLQILAPNGDDTDEKIDVLVDGDDHTEWEEAADEELKFHGWERVGAWNDQASDRTTIRRIA